ncbi:hypothetical protein [Nonomuraea rhizosphaerae]|uniref:hypothetical protein n=1 Tax=Nonomuraea rhizosphaerae TaxID=2665663 RepID=UPI001C5D4B00|nr:hypothetical protein [Nonomuraea rhizosphaerae]
MQNGDGLGDDLDSRFSELVAQFDAGEQRRMRASAAKDARAAGRPRRVRRGLLAVAAVTAVITGAGAVVVFRPDLLTPRPGVTSEPAPVAFGEPVQDRASAAVSPFAGSPAERYADGIAGFAMPEAKALGGLSGKDVAKGLERARDLLGAAFLDRQTLLGGEPAAFTKLLDRDQRTWFRDGLRGKGEDNTRGWVTSFAPGTVELAGDVIKVHGTTTLSAFKEKGLEGAKATIKYLVVYAVRSPGRPGTAIRLVAHQTGTFQIYRESGRLITWIDDWSGSTTPARCDTDDGYVHPSFDDSVPDTSVPTGPQENPYDLDQPEKGGGCRRSEST